MKRFAMAGGLMIAAFASVLLADEKAQKELEGTYVVTTLEKGGKPAPPELIATLKIVFKGEDLTIKIGEDEKKAKFKVDGTKTPHTIDITPSDGPEKGKTFPGIYKSEKGEITLIFVEKGDRPKDFKAEGEAMLMKLKKEEKK